VAAGLVCSGGIAIKASIAAGERKEKDFLQPKRGAGRGRLELIKPRIHRRLTRRLAQLEEIIKKLIFSLDEFQNSTKLS
jgi:hypothetical protein